MQSAGAMIPHLLPQFASSRTTWAHRTSPVHSCYRCSAIALSLWHSCFVSQRLKMQSCKFELNRVFFLNQDDMHNMIMYNLHKSFLGTCVWLIKVSGFCKANVVCALNLLPLMLALALQLLALWSCSEEPVCRVKGNKYVCFCHVLLGEKKQGQNPRARDYVAARCCSFWFQVHVLHDWHHSHYTFFVSCE